MILVKQPQIFALFLASLLWSGVNFAQQTRSLNVELQLDQPSDQALMVEVSVRNHSFLVVPPSFSILRPIISSVSKMVEIPAGAQNASLDFDDILTEAIDYSVRFRCVNCSSSIPLQYYTESGTTRGLGNSAYIDPDDLGDLLPVSLETLGFISGAVALGDGLDATRDIRLSLRLSDVSSVQLLATEGVLIREGANTVEYRIEGLTRRRADSYQLELQCSLCSPRVSRAVPTLPASENHQNIDFTVEQSDPTVIGVFELLLDE